MQTTDTPAAEAHTPRIGFTVDRFVMAFAGTVILLSVLLAVFASHWWLLLTMFVGANLLQAAFTGFCPLASVLKLVGVKPGAAF